MIGKDGLDCPFCERIENEEYDASWLNAVTFEPLNPVVPGHRLFVTRFHESPLENPYDVKWLRKVGSPKGVDSVIPLLNKWREVEGHTEEYNLILNAGESASQSVEHLHLHYVPRQPGDGLILPWTNQVRH